jgi:AraC-like DNA-binding protein
VRASVDEQAFRSDPVGSYVAGPSFLYFCARPDVWGFMLWGNPSRAILERLTALLAIELEPRVAPHVSLVDVSALELVDGGAFDALARYVTGHFDALAQAVTRLAIVGPSGLAGASAAGFFRVVTPPYPVEVFGSLDDAGAWLGIEDLAFTHTLTATRRDLLGLAPIVVDLMAVLEAHIRDITVEQAATQLELTSAALQRRLIEAGTTFLKEHARARVRIAKRLLLERDASISGVARDVGCASVQHFSTLFRRHEGQSPAAWRRARSPR